VRGRERLERCLSWDRSRAALLEAHAVAMASARGG
jgi:hypothetical protein